MEVTMEEVLEFNTQKHEFEYYVLQKLSDGNTYSRKELINYVKLKTNNYTYQEGVIANFFDVLFRSGLCKKPKHGFYTISKAGIVKYKNITGKVESVHFESTELLKECCQLVESTIDEIQKKIQASLFNVKPAIDLDLNELSTLTKIKELQHLLNAMTNTLNEG